MLSQLIGMTMGAYGCVCVGVWSWQPPYSCVRSCQVLHERDPLRVDKSYTAADRLTRGSLAQQGTEALRHCWTLILLCPLLSVFNKASLNFKGPTPYPFSCLLPPKL